MSSLVTPSKSLLFEQPPLQRVWNYLAEGPTLDGYANIYRGIAFSRSAEAGALDTPGIHTTPGLLQVNGCLEAFAVVRHQYINVRPERMRDAAYRLPWEQPKALVNRLPLGQDPWRIAGAADYKRLAASKQFLCVWPRTDAPPELLAAVISGPVVNAYMFAHESRDHIIEVLADAPVPLFTPEQAELIVHLVQAYTSYRIRWDADEGYAHDYAELCLHRLLQIDAAVLEAYTLPPDLEQELLSRFNGAKRPLLPSTIDFPGYGQEFAQAKASLQLEKSFITYIYRYRDLSNLKRNGRLTHAEFEEMQQLGQKIDAHQRDTNPLYGLIGIAEGGPEDGAENHDAYIYRC